MRPLPAPSHPRAQTDWSREMTGRDRRCTKRAWRSRPRAQGDRRPRKQPRKQQEHSRALIEPKRMTALMTIRHRAVSAVASPASAAETADALGRSHASARWLELRGAAATIEARAMTARLLPPPTTMMMLRPPGRVAAMHPAHRPRPPRTGRPLRCRRARDALAGLRCCHYCDDCCCCQTSWPSQRLWEDTTCDRKSGGRLAGATGAGDGSFKSAFARAGTTIRGCNSRNERAESARSATDGIERGYTRSRHASLAVRSRISPRSSPDCDSDALPPLQ